MVFLRAFAVCAAVCCWISCSFAQGSAGGYGQGGSQGSFGQAGGRGGFGGGGGSLADKSSEKSKRIDDEDAELWQNKSAVLTPGDRVEFKLKVKKGETLLAGATSDAFDPALSIEDTKGKVLLKNDDRVEGDQSPFVVYRFDKEGDYVLKVLSYRSVSGGKFNLRMRTFSAVDVALMPTQHDNIAAPNEQGRTNVVFRLVAKKDKTYDLKGVQGLRQRAFTPVRFRRIIGPTGVEDSDFDPITTPNRAVVFQAKADGDYYIEYDGYGSTDFKTDFREVRVIQSKALAQEELNIARQEVVIVEWPVKKDQIVRTSLVGAALQYVITAASNPEFTPTGGADDAYGNQRDFTWFSMNRDSNLDVVRIFHADGKARMAILSVAGADQKVNVSNVDSAPVWDSGTPIKSTIAIGDSRIFLIKAEKAELMRVFAGASHFQPKLDIFRLNGELANSLMDRVKHVATDDLYFPDAGTFLVRLSCDGHGGSGDFEMRRETLAAKPYQMGSVETMTLDGVNFGLYLVNLEAGKRYQLMTDQPMKPLGADLLDVDGQFLTSQRIRFDQVEVQYFVPTRSGPHRLWLRGEPGTRQLKFELHVPPTIGGG